MEFEFNKVVDEKIIIDESDEDEDYDEDNIESVIDDSGELIDPLKKRRGRKVTTKDEDKLQKKRGRKPKVKDEDDDKEPKKRGRKPKDKVYSVNEYILQDNLPPIEKLETVILHLPIKKIEQEETINPAPHVKKNINYSMISSTYSVQENVDLTNVKTLPKKKMDDIVAVYHETIQKGEDHKNDYDLNYSFLEGEEKEKIKKEAIEDSIGLFKEDKNIETQNDIPDSEKLISEDIKQTTSDDIKQAASEDKSPQFMQKKIDELKSAQLNYNEDDYKPNKVIKKNLKNILYEFVNSNSANSWPDTTNTHCWWCCHQFNNTPCALPEVYRKDKFHVYGIFCSFNCAASYNFSKNDGDEMWTRYNLLNLLYKKLFSVKFVKVGMAPPRETLKMFGGYMNIDEFREASLKMDRTFQVIKPPMHAIIPKIEENILSRGLKVGGGVNEHILNKTQNQLKLKRTKPLMNPNSTLQSFMNIKIS